MHHLEMVRKLIALAKQARRIAKTKPELEATAYFLAHQYMKEARKHYDQWLIERIYRGYTH